MKYVEIEDVSYYEDTLFITYRYDGSCFYYEMECILLGEITVENVSSFLIDRSVEERYISVSQLLYDAAFCLIEGTTCGSWVRDDVEMLPYITE